jgi:hypothetical protein
MTTAETYRRYAAECVALSKRRESQDERVMLVKMAEMWLRLADFAEKHQSTYDDSSRD